MVRIQGVYGLLLQLDRVVGHVQQLVLLQLISCRVFASFDQGQKRVAETGQGRDRAMDDAAGSP